jgi:hypothetical protein
VVSVDRSVLKGKAPWFSADFTPPVSCESPFKFAWHTIQSFGINNIRYPYKTSPVTNRHLTKRHQSQNITDHKTSAVTKWHQKYYKKTRIIFYLYKHTVYSRSYVSVLYIYIYHTIDKHLKLTISRRIGDFTPINFEKSPRAWIYSDRRQISAENCIAHLYHCQRIFFKNSGNCSCY